MDKQVEKDMDKQVEKEEIDLLIEFVDVIQKVGILIKKYDLNNIREEMNDDFYTMNRDKLRENMNDAQINGTLKILVSGYIKKMNLLLVKIDEKSKEI